MPNTSCPIRWPFSTQPGRLPGKGGTASFDPNRTLRGHVLGRRTVTAGDANTILLRSQSGVLSAHSRAERRDRAAPDVRRKSAAENRNIFNETPSLAAARRNGDSRIFCSGSGRKSRCSSRCQAAIRSTILPRLCGAPASISWAVRASSSGSTVPTCANSFPLSNSSVILISRAVVTST